MLRSVVFQNPIWTAWSKAVVEAINHPTDETAPKKGVAILLARNTSYGGSAFANVREILAGKCDCVAQFVGVNTDAKGVEISSMCRGQIQRELGDFLGRCSHGIVVVENIELFGPGQSIPSPLPLSPPSLSLLPLLPPLPSLSFLTSLSLNC